jgi:hypothetical protein
MCRPIHKYWHKDALGICANAPQYIHGVIGVTIATDVLVELIPAWILCDLQMSTKNKIGVIAFLSLPLAVTAIGCYRLHMFVVVFSLPPGSVEDPYNVRNALSNIEANLGVIAACGPTIKWILVSLQIKLFGHMLTLHPLGPLHSLFRYGPCKELLHTESIIAPSSTLTRVCKE